MSYLRLITSTNVQIKWKCSTLIFLQLLIKHSFAVANADMHSVQGVSSFKYSKFRKVEFFLMFVSCFEPKTIRKLCVFINNQIGTNRRSSLFGTNVQSFVNHWYLKVIIYCWILSDLNGSFRIQERFWFPPHI